MLYQKTSATPRTAYIADVIGNSGGLNNGETLVVSGLKYKDVSSNFYYLIPETVRRDYQDNASQGVCTSGVFDSDNQIVCVTGMATCAAFIAARGNSAGKNFGQFLAIHLGGDERAIESFRSIIETWSQATVNDGTLWVVGGSPNNESHLTQFWTERAIEYLGLKGGLENNVLFYTPAKQIGLKRNGEVGEPLDAPMAPTTGCCVLL